MKLVESACFKCRTKFEGKPGEIITCPNKKCDAPPLTVPDDSLLQSECYNCITIFEVFSRSAVVCLNKKCKVILLVPHTAKTDKPVKPVELTYAMPRDMHGVRSHNAAT